MLLEDTHWHQEGEKEPDMGTGVREGELFQAEGEASANALK